MRSPSNWGCVATIDNWGWGQTCVVAINAGDGGDGGMYVVAINAGVWPLSIAGGGGGHAWSPNAGDGGTCIVTVNTGDRGDERGHTWSPSMLGLRGHHLTTGDGGGRVWSPSTLEMGDWEGDVCSHHQRWGCMATVERGGVGHAWLLLNAGGG